MTDNQKPMKKVSPRRRARECAVQALYSWAISGNAPEQVELAFVVDQDLKGVDKPYFSRLFRQTVVNVDTVDFTMSHYLDRELNELDPIERAILRLAVYELQFEPDVLTKSQLMKRLKLLRYLVLKKAINILMACWIKLRLR